MRNTLGKVVAVMLVTGLTILPVHANTDSYTDPEPTAVPEEEHLPALTPDGNCVTSL